MGLRKRLLLHDASDVDDIICDDAEADPTFHSDVTFVSAAIEPMAPLDHADSSLTSDAPLLAVAEPALPLLAFALGAFGRSIRDANTLDAPGLRGRLVPERVECGVRRHQVRDAAEQCLMCLDRGDQQVRIVRPLRIDLVIGNDLVLGLLELHHFAELVRLAGLALAADLGRWLEQTEELAFTARVAAEIGRAAGTGRV